MLLILFFHTITSQTNQQILFQEIKNYRQNPSPLKLKIENHWIPNLDTKMVNSTYTANENDLNNLLVYLSNKKNMEFDNLRLDMNLSKISEQ